VKESSKNEGKKSKKNRGWSFEAWIKRCQEAKWGDCGEAIEKKAEGVLRKA
jgi:hypothetical protein